MNNNKFSGFHQLPNKFAAVSDTFLIGPNAVREELAFFLGKAADEGITDILHCGARLSNDDYILWPRLPGMRTWCLNIEGGGYGRADLLPAPPGFLIRRSKNAVMPLYLHYGDPVLGDYPTPAFHLIGGLHRRGHDNLPSGTVMWSVGTFTTNPGLIKPGGVFFEFHQPKRGDAFYYVIHKLEFSTDPNEPV